jgi:hypothetical protein
MIIFGGKMTVKKLIKVVLIFAFLFLLISCIKKQEEKKVIESENKEVITERITTNEENIKNKDENKINVFEYRGTPNYNYDDIWNLLLIKNEKKKEQEEIIRHAMEEQAEGSNQLLQGTSNLNRIIQ